MWASILKVMLWLHPYCLLTKERKQITLSGKAKLFQNRMKNKLFFITWYTENRVIRWKKFSPIALQETRLTDSMGLFSTVFLIRE